MGEYLVWAYKLVLVAWTMYCWSRYSNSKKGLWDKAGLVLGGYLSLFFIEFYADVHWFIKLM